MPGKDNAESESVIRYYTSRIALVINSNSEKHPSERLGCWNAKYLFRTPAITCIRPFKQEKHLTSFEPSTYHIIPAHGIDKDPGQPVYFGDPIQLVDQDGRILGKVNRFPYDNFIGPDGSAGPLVLSPSIKSSTNRNSSVVEICSKDHILFSGISLEVKKHFTGGCLVVSSDSDIQCQIILESTVDASVATSESLLIRQGFTEDADRMVTGEFVGSLCTGVLYKRSKVTRKWKLRYCVLTHIALHWFAVDHKTDDGGDGDRKHNRGKARGQILLSNIKAIHFHQFLAPHNFKVETISGRNNINFHSSSGVECFKWAQLLTTALDNPQWLHQDTVVSTVFRSDRNYSSSKCPTLKSISIVTMVTSLRPITVTGKSAPSWGEMINLGKLFANAQVMVETDNGIITLTMGDLNSGILHSCWMDVSDKMKWASVEEGGFDTAQVVARLKYRTKVQMKQQHLKETSVTLRNRVILVKDRLQNRLKAFSPIQKGLIVVAVAAVIQQLGIYKTVMILLTLVLGVAIVFIIQPWIKNSPANVMESPDQGLYWSLGLMAFEIRPRRSQDATPLVSTAALSEDLESEDEEEEESSISSSGGGGTSENQKRRSLKWMSSYDFRLENGLDSILGTPQYCFSVIKKLVPHYFTGVNKAGNQVMILKLNEIDWNSLSRHDISSKDVLRHFLFLWEFLWSALSDANAPDSFLMLVVDMQKNDRESIKDLLNSREFLQNLISTTNVHYPNRLLKVVAVLSSSYNNMSVFSWNAIKLLSKPLLVDQCDQVFDEKALGEIIDESNIPSFYGGLLNTTLEMSDSDRAITAFVNNTLAASITCAVPKVSPAPAVHQDFSRTPDLEQDGLYKAYVEGGSNTSGVVYVSGSYKIENICKKDLWPLINNPTLWSKWNKHIADASTIREDKEKFVLYSVSEFPPKRSPVFQTYVARLREDKCCITWNSLVAEDMEAGNSTTSMSSDSVTRNRERTASIDAVPHFVNRETMRIEDCDDNISSIVYFTLAIGPVLVNTALTPVERIEAAQWAIGAIAGLKTYRLLSSSELSEDE